MADKTIERESGKLSLSKGKLGLSKGGDSGKIRQSFSHGRTKTVTVEVKRKRGPGADGGGRGKSAGGLSEEERAARIRALRSQQKEPAGEAAEKKPAAQPQPETGAGDDAAERRRKLAEERAHREAEEAAAIDAAEAAARAPARAGGGGRAVDGRRHLPVVREPDLARARGRRR